MFYQSGLFGVFCRREDPCVMGIRIVYPQVQSSIAGSQNVHDSSLMRSFPVFEFVISLEMYCFSHQNKGFHPTKSLKFGGRSSTWSFRGYLPLPRRVNKKQGKTTDLFIKSTALEKKHLHRVSSFDENLENPSPRAARLITTPDSYRHLCISV